MPALKISVRGGFNQTHGAVMGGHAVKHAIARAGIELARHERDRVPQAVLRDRLHVLPVDLHGAVLRVVEALQQREHVREVMPRVRQHGDWEAWVDFFLEGVEQTARGAVQTARRLAEQFAADTQRMQPSGPAAANTLRVLAALRARPMLTLKHLRDRHRMTFPTATKAMQTLVAAGIARELTGRRRNRVFAYDAYLKLLNEGGQPL